MGKRAIFLIALGLSVASPAMPMRLAAATAAPAKVEETDGVERARAELGR